MIILIAVAIIKFFGLLTSFIALLTYQIIIIINNLLFVWIYSETFQKHASNFNTNVLGSGFGLASRSRKIPAGSIRRFSQVQQDISYSASLSLLSPQIQIQILIKDRFKLLFKTFPLLDLPFIILAPNFLPVAPVWRQAVSRCHSLWLATEICCVGSSRVQCDRFSYLYCTTAFTTHWLSSLCRRRIAHADAQRGTHDNGYFHLVPIKTETQ